MDALVDHPTLRYVLALQEATAVGMADGYAQVTGRPSFLNLHTSAGLGNAIGNLTNARANGSPLVVTAGQQDRRHLVAEPLLGGDLTGLAAPVSKSSTEVTRVDDLGLLMRRAFNDAMNWPRGPVFLSLPMDMLDEEASTAVLPKSGIDRRSIPAAIDTMADLLTELPPDELVIVVGDEVAASGALKSVVALAEALGVRVFATPLHATGVFPPGHPLFGGALPPSAAAIRTMLAPFRRMFLIAGRGLIAYPYTDGSPLPETMDLVHLSPDPVQLGRVLPARLGVVGDPAATVDALLPLIRSLVDPIKVGQALEQHAAARSKRSKALEDKAVSRYGDQPSHPMAAVHAIVGALPPGCLVVDEAVTNGPYLRGFHHFSEPNRYFGCRGGGLGWGMPAAVGVSLGADYAPTICVVGDGSAMYSPQALWTAARENVPVVFVVLDNGQYLILKNSLRSMYEINPAADRFVGLDLDQPPLAFTALGQSMGVPSVSVSTATELAGAVSAAFEREGPMLVHIPVGDGRT
jgi:benzoylformate decarboxylase